MKTIMVFFIFAVASSAVAGVSGIVTDSSSGLPVQQAWIRYGNNDSVQTNVSGQYSLPGLAAGTYPVVVRRSGYLNRRQQVILAVGDNTVNFSTRPLVAPMNPVGWWTFENALQPVQSDVGRDLVLQGTHQVITGPSGSGAVNIGVGSYYRCYHDIPANGGGGNWVNEFSLMIDFRVSQLGRWYSFFQTDISNTNDGDAFINTNGNIGVALTGYSSYAIQPNEWYRLIISADLGSSYKYYLDGQLLRDGGAQLLDGRFSLYSSSNGNQVLLFADDNGEDSPIDVAQAAIFNYPLTAVQAGELGGYGHIITDPATVMTPYLQSPTPTSMNISWHFRYSTESFVDYGITEALGQTATGTTQSISATVLWHTTQLTNLQPNTTYYYRCRSDTASTPTVRFHTPPAYGSRTGKLRFMLISDSQTNPARSTAVAAAMRQTLLSRFGGGFADSVQLIMHCGDIVGIGIDLASYQTEYFLPFRQINQSIPFMVSIGNHEIESSNFYSYMKYEPFAGPQGEPYYSFQLGRVLFIALNSNVQGTTQSNWCNARLQQAENDTTIDMVFVAMHHPGHSEVWPDGNTGWTLNTIFPILDAYSKVAMVSFGHSHNYERGARPESPVRTVLCGGAGGTLDRWRMYPNQTDYPEIHRSFDYHHYVLVEVDLANRSYEATAYSLGNDDHPQANMPFDHWRHTLGQNAPQTPIGLAPASEVFSPVILTGSAFAASDTIQSSHFQLTSVPGNYAAPVLNALRDFENYYLDTGSPDFLPIDRNAGVQLTELGPIDSLLQVGVTYGWRARYRDGNLKWSDWSAECTFIWLGQDTTPPEVPQALTVIPYGDHMRLRWRSVTEPGIHYHVYRDSSVAGPFTELAGTTADTVFIDSGAVVSPQLKKFYLVKTVRP